jgi:hypothetical protein
MIPFICFLQNQENISVLVGISGLGKNPGNFKKPMGMGKTGFYREKWEKREKLSFFEINV